MFATDERIKGRDFFLVLGGVLLMADTFGLDLAMPLDLAIGVPYALVVLLGLWWPGRGYIYIATIIGSGLCVLGFYFSFTGEELEKAVIDRGLALFTILMVAMLCLFQKRTQNKKLQLQKLIHHIGKIYSGEMIPPEEYSLFKNILDSLLSFTQSQFGVVGEVLENEEGKPYFENRAGVALNSSLEQPKGLPQGEKPPPSEIENYNMEPLLTQVINSGKPVLMKYATPAVSKAPPPAGHPPMKSFMGLPFYHEGRLLGVIGVANRVGGYDGAWAEYLKPFLAACAGNIHLFRIGRQKPEAENALRENSLKLQDMEKETGLLESAIEEKNARLAEIGEELERTGATLREKEAMLVKNEGDRNRAEEALWEKQERLMAVMTNFNQLEKDLEKMFQVERASQEKDRRLRQMDLEKNDFESKLQEYKTRLSRVESELDLTKKTLRNRKGLLERIGREIQENLGSKQEDLSPGNPEVMQMKSEPRGFQKSEERQPEELEKDDGASAYERDFISYDEAGQGICGLDLQGNTTFINPAGAKMLGYASKELIGKNQHTTIHHSRIDGTPYLPEECYICNTVAEGVVSHVVDEVFWRKDGSCFPVEYLSTPIRKDKRRVGAVVTFTDISHSNQNEKALEAFRLDTGQKAEERVEERKIKNQGWKNEIDNGGKVPHRFRRYAEEMERSNQDLREFASIASHDLQEPLRKIIGFGSRLKKDCSSFLDDRGRDYLGRMDQAARQMQNFIDDLLQYSKVTTLSTPYQKIDLRDVIADVLVVLESPIEETRAAIEVGTLPAIEADSIQMHQLFQNLVSNALKFQKAGQPPVIRISHRLLENGMHEIRVEDKGIGFEETHLEKIFKPFERLHGRMVFEGTGMGLAICQKIVHRHGGEITAKSSPEKGTTFIVTLPERQVPERDLPQ